MFGSQCDSKGRRVRWVRSLIVREEGLIVRKGNVFRLYLFRSLFLANVTSHLRNLGDATGINYRSDFKLIMMSRVILKVIPNRDFGSRERKKKKKKNLYQRKPGVIFNKYPSASWFVNNNGNKNPYKEYRRRILNSIFRPSDVCVLSPI